MKLIDILQLKENPDNPRTIKDAKFKLLVKSLREFPDMLNKRPLIVVSDKDKFMVLGGNMRLKALKEIRVKKVPVIIADEWTKEQRREFLIKDNASFGEWDWEALSNSFEVNELVDWGLDEKDLIFAAEENEDDVPEISEGKPRSKRGDIMNLGRHKIMAGDATDRADVEKLMGENRADLVFTDPPYGVGYVQGKYTGIVPKRKFENIKNDELRGEDLYKFLLNVWHILKKYTKSGASFYVWSPALKESFAVFNSLIDSGIKIQAQIIWNKASLVLSRSDYHWKHENCWYGFWENGKHQFYGDRTFTTVWEKEPEEKELLKWIRSRVKKDFSGKTTIWNIQRDNEYKHPTQKPVFLATRGITNSSKTEDIILDLFLGSGSTLIAAEKTGRICYGMEIDCKYIDVIVERYCQFTGNRNIQKNGKEIQWSENPEIKVQQIN